MHHRTCHMHPSSSKDQDNIPSVRHLIYEKDMVHTSLHIQFIPSHTTPQQEPHAQYNHKDRMCINLKRNITE